MNDSGCESNYKSGDDFLIEFLGYQFGFSKVDFEQRVNNAATRLGLIENAEIEENATSDLIELASEGRIRTPRSPLGKYISNNWGPLSLCNGESLVYWIRKLVFRGAWIDHRVKLGLLEATWEESTGEFIYSDPKGKTALLDVAPVPSWHKFQYKEIGE